MEGVGIANPLFFMGVVENNIDPRKEGRCQVRAFGVHGTNKQVPTDYLPWAIVVQGDYNPNNIPKINSWVFGVFVDGRDAQQPMILGLIPTQMTEITDPETNGWGVIPDGDGDLLAKGSGPRDFGEPQQSRKARGEKIEETSVLTQEMGRVRKVPIAGSDETWDQPSSAYNTQYPHNKVWETGNHTIELDDTPGGERITITHGSGSFIEIDARGTTTNKTTGDQYDIMDRKQHVVVGGMSTVTVLGNSYVRVEGDKVEEINGDLQTIVHGNHMLTVGGQSTVQAGEQVQIRGGADVKVNGSSGTVSINAGKELQLSAGGLGLPPKYGAVSIKGEKVLIDATDKLGLRGLTQVNIQSVAELNISSLTINQLATTWNAKATGATFISSGLTTDIDAGIDVAIGGGVSTNINSPFSNIGGGFVNLAPPIPPRPSIAAATTTVATARVFVPPINQLPFVPGSQSPEIAWRADKVDAPEPASKSTSVQPPVNQSSLGSVGYASTDDPNGDGGAGTALGNVTAVTASAASPLLDFIGNKESEGYDDISGLIPKHRYPVKNITDMTIQEVLDWQESIDAGQLSEAAGRYQFMEDTLRGYNNDNSTGPGNPLYSRAGVSAGSLFSPENQDKMAIVLLEQRGLSRFLKDEITKEQFANNLASEWASLPLVTGPNAGKSKYAGDAAGNRSLTSVQEFLSVLDQVKSYESTIISGGAG